MKTFNFEITDEAGIHARPAGIIVSEAKKYTRSDIKIIKGDKEASAKKLFELMLLGAGYKDVITVNILGGEEEEAAIELKRVMKECL